MDKIINKLNEAFLPQNTECDGGACMGCWKDVVREAIKMLEAYRSQTEEEGSNLERFAHTKGLDPDCSQPSQVEGLPSEGDIKIASQKYASKFELSGEMQDVIQWAKRVAGYEQGQIDMKSEASAIIAKKDKDLREQKQLWIDSESEVRALRKENEQLKQK